MAVFNNGSLQPVSLDLFSGVGEKVDPISLDLDAKVTSEPVGLAFGFANAAESAKYSFSAVSSSQPTAGEVATHSPNSLLVSTDRFENSGNFWNPIVDPLTASESHGTGISAAGVTATAFTTASSHTDGGSFVLPAAYDLASQAEIAGVSALKLAAASEGHQISPDSQDESPEFTTLQDQDPSTIPIQQDILQPSANSLPKKSHPAKNLGIHSEGEDQGKQSGAEIHQLNNPSLLSRNNLVTTISLDLPGFLR